MKTRVLVVDDEESSRSGLVLMLTTLGYEVESAADGEEAIDRARSFRPAVVIADLVMPGVDGFRATRTLANDPATRKIPVIMVSSKSQETDRIWGMRQGAVDYLVKPVTPAQLVEKAQAALLTG